MPDNGRKPDTVTLTIDGREVTVPKGTSLLDAAEWPWDRGAALLLSPRAERAGPVPDLPGRGGGRAQAAAVLRDDGPGRAGGAYGEPESATRMRKGVLEFYLVNHPLDCPICDMSGECKLQDYVFEEGRERGRGGSRSASSGATISVGTCSFTATAA